eukprot:PhF_6_TR26994/c0_g1_i3/m.39403
MSRAKLVETHWIDGTPNPSCPQSPRTANPSNSPITTPIDQKQLSDPTKVILDSSLPPASPSSALLSQPPQLKVAVRRLGGSSTPLDDSCIIRTNDWIKQHKFNPSTYVRGRTPVTTDSRFPGQSRFEFGVKPLPPPPPPPPP